MNNRKFKITYQLKKVNPAASNQLVSSELKEEETDTNEFREVFIELFDKHMDENISGLEILSINNIAVERPVIV